MCVSLILNLLFVFQRRDVYGAWEQYIGLEHSDNTPKRSYAANQVSTYLKLLCREHQSSFPALVLSCVEVSVTSRLVVFYLMKQSFKNDMQLISICHRLLDSLYTESQYGER